MIFPGHGMCRKIKVANVRTVIIPFGMNFFDRANREAKNTSKTAKTTSAVKAGPSQLRLQRINTPAKQAEVIKEILLPALR